jgi:hypothetical protein
MLASKERVRDNGISDENWFDTTAALSIPHWNTLSHCNFFTHPSYLQKSDTISSLRDSKFEVLSI